MLVYSSVRAGAALAAGRALPPRDLNIPNTQDNVDFDANPATAPFPERVMVRVVVITSVIVTAPESAVGAGGGRATAVGAAVESSTRVMVGVAEATVVVAEATVVAAEAAVVVAEATVVAAEAAGGAAEAAGGAAEAAGGAAEAAGGAAEAAGGAAEAVVLTGATIADAGTRMCRNLHLLPALHPFPPLKKEQM